MKISKSDEKPPENAMRTDFHHEKGRGEPDYKCDYPDCERKPFAEVYFFKESCWSYLCLWHFVQERRWKNMWCIADHLSKNPTIKRFWEWYCK